MGTISGLRSQRAEKKARLAGFSLDLTVSAGASFVA